MREVKCVHCDSPNLGKKGFADPDTKTRRILKCKDCNKTKTYNPGELDGTTFDERSETSTTSVAPSALNRQETTNRPRSSPSPTAEAETSTPSTSTEFPDFDVTQDDSVFDVLVNNSNEEAFFNAAIRTNGSNSRKIYLRTGNSINFLPVTVHNNNAVSGIRQSSQYLNAELKYNTQNRYFKWVTKGVVTKGIDYTHLIYAFIRLVSCGVSLHEAKKIVMTF